MQISVVFLLVLFAAVVCDANSVQTFTKHERFMEPVFEEKYFDQIIDHLNFNSHGNKTYQQRYLITGTVKYSMQCIFKCCICGLVFK